MQTFLRQRMLPIIALVAVVVLGAVLRIVPLMQREYWYDESFTGVTVRQPLAQMMDIIVHDVHPPMYYWLLKGWTVVAGSTPLALRMFSVMFGVALIVLAYVAVRRWTKTSQWPAVAAALVLAINPFFVNYSQEARMYALLAFFLLLAALLLTISWQSKQVSVRLAYGLVLLVIVLTHYLGALFALALVFTDFCHRALTMRGVATRSHLRWLGAAYLVPLLGGIAWLPFMRLQAQAHSSLGWVPNVTFEHIPVALHVFLFGAPVGVPGVPPALGYRVEWLTVPAMSILLVIALTALVTWATIKKKWDATLAMLGFMAFVPLVVTWLLQRAGLQLFVERFLTGAAVFLVLFGVMALARFSKAKMLAAVTAIYCVIILLVQPWSYAEPVMPQLVHDLGAEHETVVFTNAFDYTQGRFYLGEEQVDRLRVYNIDNPAESLAGWAMVKKGAQIAALPTESHLVVTTQPDRFTGYRVVKVVDGVSILSSM